jgi:flagellar motor switch protein FliN/FliY
MKLGKLEDVKVRLKAILGEADVCVRNLSELVEGKIVEFTSLAGEPIGLYAADEKIAEGEVVIIDENFGLRITKLANREDK